MSDLSDRIKKMAPIPPVPPPPLVRDGIKLVQLKGSSGMSDAELIALAALANVESVVMAQDNYLWNTNNGGQVWAAGHGFMQATTKLQNELSKRGVL